MAQEQMNQAQDKKIELVITTPRGVKFMEKADMVIMRVCRRGLGVLPGHAPVSAALVTAFSALLTMVWNRSWRSLAASLKSRETGSTCSAPLPSARKRSTGSVPRRIGAWQRQRCRKYLRLSRSAKTAGSVAPILDSIEVSSHLKRRNMSHGNMRITRRKLKRQPARMTAWELKDDGSHRRNGKKTLRWLFVHTYWVTLCLVRPIWVLSMVRSLKAGTGWTSTSER